MDTKIANIYYAFMFTVAMIISVAIVRSEVNMAWDIDENYDCMERDVISGQCLLFKIKD